MYGSYAGEDRDIYIDGQENHLGDNSARSNYISFITGSTLPSHSFDRYKQCARATSAMKSRFPYHMRWSKKKDEPVAFQMLDDDYNSTLRQVEPKDVLRCSWTAFGSDSRSLFALMITSEIWQKPSMLLYTTFMSHFFRIPHSLRRFLNEDWLPVLLQCVIYGL